MHHHDRRFGVLVSFVLVLCPSVFCGKILLWPFPYYSHIKELTNIGEALHKNGHEIHIVLPPSLPQIQEFRDKPKVKVIEYKVKDKDFHSMPPDEFIDSVVGLTPIQDFRTNTKGCLELCTNALADDTFYLTLKNNGYDLALIDAFPISRCYYILLYRLGIPYISHVTQYEPWLLRAPALPSFVPVMLHYPGLSPEMTFFERLSNAYTLLDWTAFPNIHYLDDGLVAKYAPDMPLVTINWLAGRSLLWFLNTDIAIDYPRPIMPNEVNIGGLSTKPSNKLPADLQKFMDSAKHGVILASFGSLSTMPKDDLQVLIDAFKQVKQHVLFRYVHDPKPKVPAHVKLLDWVPQNDVLAHPQTKLFITHCGANSQFEALYHAVPMMNFPFYGDQPYNARRADYKGYSKTMSMAGLNSSHLVNSIREIISNDSYADAIKHGSAVFRSSSMHPKERAVHWIEHVLEFGGEHLHSYALDMPWYTYLMLDIIGLLLLVIAFVLFIIAILFRFCIKILCKSKKPDVKLKKQ